MPRATPAFSLPEALLAAYETNDRINQYMIENLPAEAWRAETPDGKGRTIAAIAAHMHNVRVMWLKAAAKGSKIPEQLDRTSVTPAQAAKALEQSRSALSAVMKSALENDGRVKGFRPDVAGFLGYLISHDAHHRGQICMLARQVGHALPQKANVRHVGVGKQRQRILAVRLILSSRNSRKADSSPAKVVRNDKGLRPRSLIYG